VPTGVHYALATEKVHSALVATVKTIMLILTVTRLGDGFRDGLVLAATIAGGVIAALALAAAWLRCRRFGRRGNHYRPLRRLGPNVQLTVIGTRLMPGDQSAIFGPLEALAQVVP
jgi:hypothetical protein